MVMVEKTDMTGEMDKINKNGAGGTAKNIAGIRWISHAGRV